MILQSLRSCPAKITNIELMVLTKVLIGFKSLKVLLDLRMIGILLVNYEI
jgi:hypothetical protein